MFNKIKKLAKKLVFGAIVISAVTVCHSEEAEAVEIIQYENTYSTPVENNTSVLEEGKVLVAPIRNNRYVPYNYLTEIEKEDYNYLVNTVSEHFDNLEKLGVNTTNLEDVAVLFDIQHKTNTHGGGYYVYNDRRITWNPNNFVGNTVVVNKTLYPTAIQRASDTKQTFIHEFGHHIGYSVLHRDRNYTDFHNIRGTKYVANENYMYYPSSWRNLEFEQVAETYTELFFDNYTNKSASPNLSLTQKQELVNLLQFKIN